MSLICWLTAEEPENTASAASCYTENCLHMSKCPSLEVYLESQLASDSLLADLESRLAISKL